MHNSNLKAQWDYKNSIAFAADEAEHKRALEIASDLKKEGLSNEFIARTTKLPIEEVEKL